MNEAQEDDIPGGPDWLAVKSDYENRNGLPRDICKRHGITEAQLRYRRETENWMRWSARRVERGALINRMLGVLDKQVRILEKQMTGSVDKEAMLLGTMAKTLEKLIELETAERGTKPAQKKDIRDLRDKLAKRIDQLKQG